MSLDIKGKELETVLIFNNNCTSGHFHFLIYNFSVLMFPINIKTCSFAEKVGEVMSSKVVFRDLIWVIMSL